MRRRDFLERAALLPVAGSLSALLAACGADGGLRLADDVTPVDGPTTTEGAAPSVVAAPDAATTTETRAERSTRRAARIAGRWRIGGTPRAVAWYGSDLWTVVEIDAGEGITATRLAQVSTGSSAVRSQALDGVFRPTSIAVSDEGVWVADASVLRLDPASGGTVAAVDVGAQARSRLLAANGELWAAVVEAEVAQGRVLRISTVDDRIATASEVGPATAAVTPFAGALWTLDLVAGAVRQLDPATLEELAVYQLRDASAQVLGVEITAYADAIWAAFVDGVVRVDPATGEVLSDTAATVGEIATMAAGSGAVWAVSTRVLDDRAVLQRLDPVTGRFSGRPLATGAPAYAMATGGGAVWIADSAGTVSRVVPT